MLGEICNTAEWRIFLKYVSMGNLRKQMNQAIIIQKKQMGFLYSS